MLICLWLASFHIPYLCLGAIRLVGSAVLLAGAIADNVMARIDIVADVNDVRHLPYCVGCGGEGDHYDDNDSL